MNKSKMKGFNPVIKDGQTASYTTQHGTYYNFMVEFEDGTKGQASSSKTTPSWKIGEEYEFEVVVNGNYTNIKKMKPANSSFGGGGYKKPMKSITDIKRMVKANAIHALVTINAAYNEERLTGKELAIVEAFTLGGVSGEIEAFGEESSLLASRLAAINNTAISAKYKSFASGQQIVDEATKVYNYVIK